MNKAVRDAAQQRNRASVQSESLRAAVSSVRRLLARLEHSHEALHRLARAEQLLAKLTPQLAVLEATPFGTLPDLVVEPAAAQEMAARARHPFEWPERPASKTAKAASDLAEAGSATLVPSRSPSERSRPDARPVPALRLHAPRARGQTDLVAVVRPAQPLPPSNRPAATSAGSHVGERVSPARDAEVLRRIPDGAAGSERTIDLACLVERVLLARNTNVPARTTTVRLADSPAAGAARTGAFAGPAESFPSNPAQGSLPPSLLPGRAGFRLTPTPPRPDIPYHERTASGPTQSGSPDAAPQSTDPVFYFDPLEPRRSAADADEVLPERINEVLREQARRQGVDLT